MSTNFVSLSLCKVIMFNFTTSAVVEIHVISYPSSNTPQSDVNMENVESSLCTLLKIPPHRCFSSFKLQNENA